MTKLKEIFKQSTFEYFTDNKMRIAIDSLKGGIDKQVPDSLEWNELNNYYRSVLAAQQFECEYPISMGNLFDRVWSKFLLKGFMPASPKEMMGLGYDLSISGMHKNEYYDRCYLKTAHVHEFSVGLFREKDKSVAKAIYRRGPSKGSFAETEWEWDEKVKSNLKSLESYWNKEDEWYESELLHVIDEKTDIAKLTEFASIVSKAIPK